MLSNLKKDFVFTSASRRRNIIQRVFCHHCVSAFVIRSEYCELFDRDVEQVSNMKEDMISVTMPD